MPPLTSPSGCGGCLRMSQKISELEGRISMLYQIRDDEQILDSLVTIGPAATTTACELDDTVPWMDVAARSDHWSQLGAKPTPSQREPWTDVRRGKHRGKLICRPTPPRALQLTNGYSILGEEDFPPRRLWTSPSEENASSNL
ncbi:Frizzled-1 [Dissostichus eleginoides]|uniref:Frizzled-1 n=1 Tax=Dissostichus eleginoides TaxID=100907 RepID=A0AAD9CHN7_DISEL|nr:Frizzled-1 [Dissostichus eleginoides]